MRTVQEYIDVDAAVEQVYSWWANVENLPRFMEGIESVRVLEDGTLSWVGVLDGIRREWHSELIEDRPGEVFQWNSAGPHGGAGGRVTFDSIDDERTRVTAEIDWPSREMVVSSLERFRDLIRKENRISRWGPED
jgi:uncharacterized membrane protein